MKQIIILEQAIDAPSNVITFTYALWATVPAARQTFKANASITSAYKNISAPELTALQNGSVVERVDTANINNDGQLSLAALWPSIQSDLQARWVAFQAEVNSKNYWNHYGTSWDGTTWSIVTVA